MPRTARTKSSTGIYHVMLRGINRQIIFEEAKDYAMFLELLAKVKAVSGCKLFGYCLMNNHVHLLIKEGHEPLAQIFRRLGARYVFWFNWKYQRSGHLFQDRFRSEPIETEGHFIMALCYLYQNPVKAGLCKHCKDYEWSSRRLLGSPSIIDEDELFGIIDLDEITSRENQEVGYQFLEPKRGRKPAFLDEVALCHLKELTNTKSAVEFQSLNREKQGKALADLREMGASERQLARLSGLSRPVVARLCRETNK